MPGHNHFLSCTCGWCGGARSSIGVRTRWQYGYEDFCRPTDCPKCGAEVYFVRHNGGSVWFDELGPPWPKHECFADDGYGSHLRTLLAARLRLDSSTVFGIIIEAVATRPKEGGRIVVRCSDETVIDEEFNSTSHFPALLGRLVMVIRDGPRVSLRFVTRATPRVIASWDIFGPSGQMYETYPYAQEAEARQMFEQLQARYPGSFSLQRIKRREESAFS